MDKTGKIIPISRYFLAKELLRNPEKFIKLEHKLRQAKTLNKIQKINEKSE